jgi:hypothetical protein
LIVVDTSVWVDYFNGVDNREVEILDAALGVEAVAIGDLILLEILQAFKSDKDYELAKKFLHNLTTYTFLNPENAVKCAESYRYLRKKGLTIRKNLDVIIATFCIQNEFPLLFTDKDFKPFVNHLGLISAGENRL